MLLTKSCVPNFLNWFRGYSTMIRKKCRFSFT